MDLQPCTVGDGASVADGHATQTPRFRVLRSDRGAPGCPPPGTVVFSGRDGFGCASEDTRHSGVDYIACSLNESGIPFFTIPRADLEQLPVMNSPPASDHDEAAASIAGVTAQNPETQDGAAPDASSELFSVCQFFRDGSYKYVRRGVAPGEALDAALHCSSSVAARLGMVRRVIIVDMLDCVNWEWRFGEGVVFPVPPGRQGALS
jgi:hypothetical protein